MVMNTLTPALREALEEMPPPRRRALMELRLRAGAPARAVFAGGEELLCRQGRPVPVTTGMLKELLDRATGFSPYALRMEESGLYLPLEGGCRMGLCGEAAVKGGTLTGLRSVSAVAIRFARERRGVAEGAARAITRRGYVESALILSPPGGGKTTFLRDLIRGVSERGFRVAVADERRELAAAVGGVAQMDLGPCTDVLSGCPKGQGLGLLLRVMNPQALAADELAGAEELRAAWEAAQCGVGLLTTAHARDLRGLLRRPGWRELMESGAFVWCVTLEGLGSFRMERLDGYVEDCGGVSGGGGFGHDGAGDASEPSAAAAAPAGDVPGPGADAGGDGAAAGPGGGAV